MSQQGNDTPAEDVEVVEPPSNLKHIVSEGEEGGPPQIDTDAIDRAEKAMDKLSVSFNVWIGDDVNALREAYKRVDEHGLEGGAREQLFRTAHDLRGESANLGFPLVGQIASSLADLVSLLPDDTHVPPALIESHVQAICAMVREEAKGEDNKTAVTLTNCLREAAHAFLHGNGAYDDEIALSDTTQTAA